MSSLPCFTWNLISGPFPSSYWTGITIAEGWTTHEHLECGGLCSSPKDPMKQKPRIVVERIVEVLYSMEVNCSLCHTWPWECVLITLIAVESIIWLVSEGPSSLRMSRCHVLSTWRDLPRRIYQAGAVLSCIQPQHVPLRLHEWTFSVTGALFLL